MSPSLFPPTGCAIFIGDDGQDPEDLDVEYVGFMPVVPANPPGGLAAPAPVAFVAVAPIAVPPAAVAPVPVAPVAVPPAPVAPAAVAHAAAAAVGTNLGVRGRDPATQHQQALIAAGNIGNPQIIPMGIHGRNPNQVALLAQMNQEVARGIVNLNSFLPSADECRQACLEAGLTSANQRHTSAIANGRSTAAIEQLIDRLENQLDAILNTI